MVVKTSGLVLIPIGKEGKRRISPPEKGVAKRPKGSPGEVEEASAGVSGYVVTAILKRKDGGKSGAVINGVFVEEGAVLPFAFNAVGIDPAISAGPFVTLLNDLFCILIYLGLSTLLVTGVI